MKQTLSKNEWILLEALWQRAPLYLSELMEAMKTSVDWNRSSYLTYLKRMTDQELISYDTVRGSRRYLPLVNREDCAAAESAAVLEKMTAPSAKLFLASMVENCGLSREDQLELQSLIARLSQEQREEDK